MQPSKSSKTQISKEATFFPLHVFYAHFLFLFAYMRLCAFCAREEKKIEKREKSTQCKCTKYRCPRI